MKPNSDIRISKRAFWMLLFAPHLVIGVSSVVALVFMEFMFLGSLVAFGASVVSALVCGRYLIARMDVPRWRLQLFQFCASVLIFVFHLGLMLAGCSFMSR